MNGLLAAAAATFAMLASSSAMADQQGGASGTASSSDQESANLGEIIVTAERRSERLHDVPITIIAKTGDDLAAAGVDNIRDLNIVVPGFSLQTQVGFVQPVIRGISTAVNSAGADAPTAIYVDGIYQPNKGGNLFDLADVERVEVLKGPQGTLFGRNAVAGAVSIFTLSPSLTTTTGKLMAEVGEYHGDGVKTSPHEMLKGYVSTPLIQDVLAMSFSGLYDHVDGYLTNDRTGGRAGKIDNYLGRLKLLFQPKEGMRFLVTGVYNSKNDYASAATTPANGNAVAAFYPDGIVASRPWHVSSLLEQGASYYFNRYAAGSLKAEFDLGAAGTLTSTTAYTRSGHSGVYDITAAYSRLCLAAYACVPYDVPSYSSKTFQQELNFASAKFGDFSFVAGAFFYRDYSDYIANTFPGLTPDGEVDRSVTPLLRTDVNLNTRAWAGYGEATYDVTSKLRLTAGIRYSHEKKFGEGSSDLNTVPFHPYPSTGPAVDSAWTPRVSVRYDISDSTNVYATYSKGFKSMIIDSDSATDANAKAEKLSSYEIGMKVSTPTFSINADTFYYDYKDVQVYWFNGIEGGINNAANAQVVGLEADLGIKLSRTFTLTAGASWLPQVEYKNYQNAIDYALPNGPFGMTQVSVDLSGTTMLRAPRFTGNTALNYKNETAWGTIDGNVNVYYSSRFYWEPLHRVPSPSYGVVNAQMGLTPTGSKFRVGVYCRNLTNKAVQSGYILTSLTDGLLYNEPREFGLQVQYSF